MHELVHPALHSKLLFTRRLPSFAGTGLPERMRSISFALLGLTAAAGLALVAIFAQPGFPLLSPAPLPAEPSASESIGRAEALPLAHAPVAVRPARPAPARPHEAGSTVQGSANRQPDAGAGGNDESQVAPAEVDLPAPGSPPEPSSGNSGDGEAGNENGGDSSPVPTAAPAQPAAAPSTPAPSPQPSPGKPEAIASAPKPEPVAAPGNSSSTAAAEHASERGIEASAGHGPASAAATVESSEPESSSAPGDGNGLAKGHYK